MPSQHKHPPVSFRPPEADRAWLLDYAKATGRPVNAVLTAALAAYRRACELQPLAEQRAGYDWFGHA